MDAGEYDPGGYERWIAAKRRQEKLQREAEEHLMFLYQHREDPSPEQRAFVEAVAGRRGLQDPGC